MEGFFNKKMWAVPFLALVMTISHSSLCNAGRKHPEVYYQKEWCAAQNGTLESVVPSGARCDCLTTTHAIEFDFADKWAEAIGQSLHYATQTEKKAGIVIIMENPDRDNKLLKRLKMTIEENDLPIDYWLLIPMNIKTNKRLK